MKVDFPTEDEVRSKAYQIYLEHGSQPGHAFDDWVQAEYELIQLPVHEIAEVEVKAIEEENSKHLKLFHLVRNALLKKRQK